MGRYFIVFFLFLNLIAVDAQASVVSKTQADGCFPDSQVRFPVVKSKNKRSLQKSNLQDKSLISLSKERFNFVMDQYEDFLKIYISRNFGKELVLIRNWESDRVNAHATRDDDNNPIITIDGGLARHPEITEDGLAFIFCHEIGHQFGGAPKQMRGTSQKRSWSSAEGQADYFAATKCLPKLFFNQEENHRVVTALPRNILEQASLHCHNDLCKRILAAGLASGKVFASVKSSVMMPSLKVKDSVVVSSTILGHPSPQCRVDTVAAGVKCQIDPEINFDPQDPSVGACFGQEDGIGEGNRPECWFNPSHF